VCALEGRQLLRSGLPGVAERHDVVYLDGFA